MKRLKLFEEFTNTPPQNQLHIFDFDDTIAIGNMATGIALMQDGNPIHKNLGDIAHWITSLGMDKHDLIKGPNGKAIELTPHTNIWTAYVSSGALNKAIKEYPSKFITGTEETIPNKPGDMLVLDFTPSSSIGKAKPINPVINKMKRMEDEGATTMVMTARRGEGEGTSIDGAKIHASNVRDVKAYLKAHGIVPDEVLGVLGGNKGERIKDEVKKIKDEANKEDPTEIHFYDDSEENIEAVKNSLGSKTDADLFLYGPGKFAKKEADPEKPTDKIPAKK